MGNTPIFDCKWMGLEKSKKGATQECYVLFWTNPGSNTLQNDSCTATCLPSYKPSK